MARGARARLGKVTFLVDPLAVEWDFRMKVAETETVGGKVIQVFGTDLGDMVVTGTMGVGDRSRGDEEGWEALDRFRRQVEEMAETSATGNNPVHRFSVPVMDWAFDVYIKNFSPITHSNASSSPHFTMTLFIVEDITGKVTTGVRDRYIERLAKGVGWSQSEYNGPSEEAVEAMLAPYDGSPGLAYKAGMVEAFTSAMGAVGLPGGAAVGAGSILGTLAGPSGLNAYLWALREQESGGNYTVVNSIGAAGAYQYMPGTWNGYKGYSSAHLAPASVQDERAAADATAAYNKYKTWAAAASIHYSGQYWPADSYVWDKPQAGGPTIRQYVNQVLSRMAQAPMN